jgi:hypothetical protein
MTRLRRQSHHTERTTNKLPSFPLLFPLMPPPLYSSSLFLFLLLCSPTLPDILFSLFIPPLIPLPSTPFPLLLLFYCRFLFSSSSNSFHFLFPPYVPTSFLLQLFLYSSHFSLLSPSLSFNSSPPILPISSFSSYFYPILFFLPLSRHFFSLFCVLALRLLCSRSQK